MNSDAVPHEAQPQDAESQEAGPRDALPRQARSFLHALDQLLADLPAAARASALDDVTAHIYDALDSGRKITDTMAGLGRVDEFAQLYREELRVSTAVDFASLRQTGLLHLVTVVVALFAGTFAAFLAPAASVAESSGSNGGTGGSGAADTIELTTRTLAEAYGAGGIALLMLPAFLALLPLILPLKWRTPVAIANAVVITGFSALAGFIVGMFFAPLAVMMWAAVIVPWRMAKGLQFANAPFWRIFGSVLIALPAVLIVSGGLSGAVLPDPPLWVGAAVVVALAVAFAVGVRASALTVAVLGLAGMVVAMTQGGMLAFSFWWFGGLYLAFGISAFVAWGTKEQKV